MKAVSVAVWFLVVCLLLAGCVKDNTRMSASEMMVGKFWYLERKTTPQQTLSFVGLPTYNFKIENSNYNDSDGLLGTYSVTQQANSIILTVTIPNRAVTAYTVKHVGLKHLVLAFGSGTTFTELYFSARQ